MLDRALNTPVAFLIFNRPDTTALVFAEIARAKPAKLLVISDGPRPDRLGEAERVAATRAIIDRVDWECEVLTHYSDMNLGCKQRVSSGIDWVFEQVEEAIILEDDCLPHPSFFPYCEELLARYRHDSRVGMISGSNFQFGQHRGDASYYFSKYCHIWGWATWRRAWQHYSVQAKHWPAFRDGNWLGFVVPSKRERKHWENIFQTVYDGHIDTWDYQWLLTCWSQNMVSAIPNVNLISNLGFGADATHTQNWSPLSNLVSAELPRPLHHPEFICPHHNADKFTAHEFFAPPMMRRIQRKLRSILGLRHVPMQNM